MDNILLLERGKMNERTRSHRSTAVVKLKPARRTHGAARFDGCGQSVLFVETRVFCGYQGKVRHSKASMTGCQRWSNQEGWPSCERTQSVYVPSCLHHVSGSDSAVLNQLPISFQLCLTGTVHNLCSCNGKKQNLVIRKVPGLCQGT